MKYLKLFFVLIALFILPCFTGAGTIKAQSISVQDQDIKAMVEEISSQNLEKLVKKMVSFGTRHSLSSTSDKNRGIGAAREWVKSEFEKYAQASGGRMEVKMDRYTVKADDSRIPQDTEMVNAMAILKGSDPTDPRIIIVSGHLDSRATDVMD
nr:peptidase M28 [Bacteroidota bacterium]